VSWVLSFKTMTNIHCVYIQNDTELAATIAVGVDTVVDELCLSNKHILTLCLPWIKKTEVSALHEFSAKIKIIMPVEFPRQTH